MNHHHPHPRNDWDGGLFNGPHPGISIRMWLAGQALSGLLTNPNNECFSTEAFVKSALNYADALLTAYAAAREEAGER